MSALSNLIVILVGALGEDMLPDLVVLAALEPTDLPPALARLHRKPRHSGKRALTLQAMRVGQGSVAEVPLLDRETISNNRRTFRTKPYEFPVCHRGSRWKVPSRSCALEIWEVCRQVRSLALACGPPELQRSTSTKAKFKYREAEFCDQWGLTVVADRACRTDCWPRLLSTLVTRLTPSPHSQGQEWFLMV